MTKPNPAGEPQKNEDLASLHRQLVGLVAKLDLSMDDAPDAASVKRIADQIVALNSRVNKVGQALFAAQTAQITEAATAITSALPKVEKAIDDAERAEEAAAGLALVLKLVDKVIGTAGAIA